MISKKEVEHIAKLARLGLTEDEKRKFQKELSSILDYMKQLKEVNISGIEPTSHSVLVENIMREDKESQKPKIPPSLKDPRLSSVEALRRTGKSQKLLDLAPKTKNKYVKVKAIL